MNKNREKELLRVLANHKGYQTAEELSILLEVSSKTIYRLVKNINEEAMKQLIFSEKGKGYALNFDLYIEDQPIRKQSRILTPLERRTRIMETILYQAPKSIPIDQLYEEYFVSDSVISNDEKMIGEKLKEYKLEYCRKNKQVWISGEELQIRHALSNSNLLLQVIDLDELKRSISSSLNHYDVAFILEQLRYIELKQGVEIPHPYNINIFSHLYIVINRMKKSGIVQNKKERLTLQQDKTKEEQLLYEISKGVIQQIQYYLHCSLPEEELQCLYQYLLSCRMKNKMVIELQENDIVQQMTKIYITKLAYFINKEVDTSQLYIELYQHLRPMMNRLENRILIKNRLLEQIQAEYSSVYKSVHEVSKNLEIEFSIPEINEDEVGFITLYFAKILELHPKSYKTVIMCTTGLGTSELLKVKVKKKFPQLEIIDVIASKDTTSMLKRYPDIDIILSTVYVSEEVRIPTIVVSAMFTTLDQERVQTRLGMLK